MTPDKDTIQELFLPVGNDHRLYVQEWGNPKANTSPIIFLHGGPGAGCNDKQKGLFNPANQHVIFFDQRGSGHSQPYGRLEHNTTDDLVSDITKIANHFAFDMFTITGGSWGSCLALTYAIRHPKRVHAMALRGIFTGAQEEQDYIDQGGFRTFFPEVWERFVEATPKEHRKNPAAYHHAQMQGENVAAARRSACAYSNLEGALMKLDDRFRPTEPEDPHFDPVCATIESHYLSAGCFLPDDRYILKNAHKLTMPIWLVQGRYDMVCPPKTAYALHKLLPNSHLLFAIGGHSGGEHEIENILRTILQSQIGTI
ncbi:MAG TPA: prolyl aminopeptidase [Patescibacteria group bacterium]|nr:prolyl aminopeptidase [Patescibacteria group bacterium]